MIPVNEGSCWLGMETLGGRGEERTAAFASAFVLYSEGWLLIWPMIKKDNQMSNFLSLYWKTSIKIFVCIFIVKKVCRCLSNLYIGFCWPLLLDSCFSGHLKFWKKKPVGIEFAKHFRSHLGPIEGLAVSCAILFFNYLYSSGGPFFWFLFGFYSELFHILLCLEYYNWYWTVWSDSVMMGKFSFKVLWLLPVQILSI